MKTSLRSPEKISGISIPDISLAPITGYTDHPFRMVLRELGFKGLVYSEMIDCHSVIYNSEKALQKLFFDSLERPIAIQISGNDFELLKKAVLIIEEKFKPDFINLNLGCPTKRTTGSNNGAALLKDKNKIQVILDNLLKILTTPLTVKTRLGWNSPEEIFDLIEIFNQFKLGEVIIHLRTRNELFRSPPHWELYDKIRNKIKIPFSVNGEIFSVEDIIEIMRRYNPPKLMIGRGFIRNPWLYKQYAEMLRTNKYKPVGLDEKLRVFKRHLSYNIKFYGEPRGIKRIRKFIRKYFSYLPDATKLTSEIMKLETEDEILGYLRKIRQ